LALLVIATAGSLFVATLILRGRRARWRLLGAGLGVIVVLDVVACSILRFGTGQWHQGDPAQYIPHFKQMTAAGLVSHPGSSRPASPVRVKFVAVDSGTTYVEYEILDPLHAGMAWKLELVDEHGNRYMDKGSIEFAQSPLLMLMPWRPSSVRVIKFPGLPPGTGAVDLQFATLSAAGSFSPPGEVVRVALSRQTQTYMRTVHPSITLTARGVVASIERLSNSALGAQIAYRLSAQTDIITMEFKATVADARGHAIHTAPLTPQCDGSALSSRCTYGLALGAQPRGARLLLTIPAFGLPGARPTYGPWRLTLTMP
jgi:hypothetical protein